jgi:GNAT superfamily N-acetyltransferase
MTIPIIGSGYVHARRPYNEFTDRGFIIKSWLRHLKPTKDTGIRAIPPFNSFSTEDLSHHKKIIARLLELAPPIIACSADVPEQILAWCCAEIRQAESGDEYVMHFLYTKSAFRKRGIAAGLLDFAFPGFGEQTIYTTFPSRGYRHLYERWRLKYDPWRIVYVPENISIVNEDTSGECSKN